MAQYNKSNMIKGRDPEDSGLVIRECVGHKKEITKIN